MFGVWNVGVWNFDLRVLVIGFGIRNFGMEFGSLGVRVWVLSWDL